ncbi:MAG: flagellar hook-basal body complex protein FliE [Clostridia bacterium]|nr:flagellar hook-basal body complex protein FliE [Clostridia bacterium]
MKISSVDVNYSNKLLVNNESSKNNVSFGDLLSNALRKTNELQLVADEKARAFSLGDSTVDISDLMISMEKAGLALSLTIEIRNKLLESYQEIMRMQV